MDICTQLSTDRNVLYVKQSCMGRGRMGVGKTKVEVQAVGPCGAVFLATFPPDRRREGASSLVSSKSRIPSLEAYPYVLI